MIEAVRRSPRDATVRRIGGRLVPFGAIEKGGHIVERKVVGAGSEPHVAHIYQIVIASELARNWGAWGANEVAITRRRSRNSGGDRSSG